MQILQDFKFLAEGNILPCAKLIELLPLVKGETSYLVNTAAGKIMGSIKRFLDEDSEAEHQTIPRRRQRS